MGTVFTPDGWGQVLRTESARGRTSYLVKGAGFEGWYDSLQATADFADSVDDVVPNEDNNTVLPYPSAKQGPGWDNQQTIEPGIDPHIEYGHPSDSLTGDNTDEDPVKADIEGLFEPHSRISRVRRLHFAASDDPILEVSRLPEESPSDTGADTEDLFDDSRPHFERASATYDRLVIEDDLSFLRFASDDDEDDKKDDHKEQRSDSDDSDDDDDDDDHSGGDGPFTEGDDDSSDGDDSDGGDGGGSHTAAFALTTTADLHFLANLCVCAEELPLHSKSEHRELVAEGGLKQKRRKNQPLGNRPLKGQHGDENPKTPKDAGYSSDTKGVGKAIKRNPKRRQDKGQYGVNKLEPIHADFETSPGRGTPNNVTPQKRDLDKLLERYTDDEDQQWTHQESNLENLVDHSQDDANAAGNYNHYASVEKAADGNDKYIGSNGDGTYHLIASGTGKLPKGEHYGHYESYEAAKDALGAIEAIHHSSVKTAAPAQPPQPTQIESQIEQLMQFWAVDSNGWWHWTGSQSDLALLNQMQQQMAVVGMPQGQPGAMQAQSSFGLEANTPAPWREYLQTIASDKLVALAAWKDVVEKSKRLRAEGAIAVEVFKPDIMTAYVQGDHGRYYTTVQRLGSVRGMGRQNMTSSQVSGWSCDCDWGHWAFLRKRSFVGRMCSHAYAVFSEMRSLDAKARKAKGKPRTASTTKTAWVRTATGGFEWVSNDPTAPTAALYHTASGWSAQVWSDGTSEDSLSVGLFRNSGLAQRATSRILAAHLMLAAEGDIDLVDDDPYSQDGEGEAEDTAESSPQIQESDNTKTSALSVFADLREDHDDGQEDDGSGRDDDGIEEEEDPSDEDSLDEEIAEDEDNSNDGQDDSDDDGGHYEEHKRDDDDSDDDEGTNNSGDDSDDEHVEKHSSVSELQQQYGLTHLAGANYTLAQQDKLVREGEGKTARNHGDLNIAGTHYEAAAKSDAEDVLAFLF